MTPPSTNKLSSLQPSHLHTIATSVFVQIQDKATVTNLWHQALTEEYPALYPRESNEAHSDSPEVALAAPARKPEGNKDWKVVGGVLGAMGGLTVLVFGVVISHRLWRTKTWRGNGSTTTTGPKEHMPTADEERQKHRLSYELLMQGEHRYPTLEALSYIHRAISKIPMQESNSSRSSLDIQTI